MEFEFNEPKDLAKLSIENLAMLVSLIGMAINWKVTQEKPLGKGDNKSFMKKLQRIIFEFEDSSYDVIEDPRAALLFQSRCNSAGVLSGMEDHILPFDGKIEIKEKEDEQPK